MMEMRLMYPRDMTSGGLASNSYNGHTFWDCETWMYPSLLMFDPEIAGSLLQYAHPPPSLSLLRSSLLPSPLSLFLVSLLSLRCRFDSMPCPSFCAPLQNPEKHSWFELERKIEKLVDGCVA